ncbi:Glutathione S-transferase U19 [Madurella mycetomatis]|uniref:Glutathione S-transferase U19 n=1 Tax=Madurella mycetomatis TaxID=100816 RepID=A0A175W6F0_9PEZI|nr:Glutathione S-transferase U19 [Madurella mycetomatis]
MDPAYTTRAPVASHSVAHAHHAQFSFDIRQQARLRGAEGAHDLSSLDVSGVNVVGASPVFHTAGLDGFSSTYGARPSVASAAAAAAAAAAAVTDHSFSGSESVLAGQRQHDDRGRGQHQQQPQRKQLPQQRQNQQDQRLPVPAASADIASPSLGRFGILDPPSIDSPAATGSTRNWRTESRETSPSRDSEAAHGRRLPIKFVENPLHLDEWRRKLFDLEEAVFLTEEQFAIYFTWVDNVYSHRSTQQYKRKRLVTHYYDCRMKGRPPGRSKPDDSNNKKKRKRTARGRDLCDVKIKITEYPAGSASDLQAGDGVALNGSALAEALTILQSQRLFLIQRTNGNGTSGGSDGAPTSHKHSLAKSDEIKKNSVQRWLLARQKEARRNQKPSPWKPTGEAAATAKKHTKNSDIKFYSACFCPFSQRVWIALEAKGLDYQYHETYPLRRPKPIELLEANLRGLVPVIWQDGWACSESSVILEYLEDLNNITPLHPTNPRLKATCRMWINFINTRIVPSFYSVLAATDDEGPYFLFDHMCLVDIHFAPFAVRLSRLGQKFGGWVLPSQQPRLQRWLDAIEQNPHVRNTMSSHNLYAKSVDDLLKGFQRGLN